ncbi:MAG: sigma-70 family RNA polymerase sigma factor [Chloroflexota bacterium]|nr:sigma-70 family RNA polymerase sigma factor [Chloroflexota bacterium]
MMNSDKELIARTQAGDLSAFECLFHKYKNQIYRTALGITGDHGMAEEILQDCFLKAYSHINHLHGDYSLLPWLYRITVNLSYDYLRKHKWRSWLAPLENFANYLTNSEDPVVTSPETRLEREELQSIVRAGIAELNVKYRVVIVLHYLQGFSLEEIAYILDCPVGTVKSRLYYARKALKHRFEKNQRLVGEVIYEPA